MALASRTPGNSVSLFLRSSADAQRVKQMSPDKKEPVSARHRERTDQSLKGGEHLLRLIDDILDLSRIEVGGVSISTEPVGVVEILEEVTATLRPMATSHGLRLDLALPSLDLPMLSADRTRFKQILMNFGSNAIKYNRASGSVVFAVSLWGLERLRVTGRTPAPESRSRNKTSSFNPFNGRDKKPDRSKALVSGWSSPSASPS